MSLRVVLIDDEALVRNGLAQLLSEHVDVVGQAVDGRDGLELCRRLRPDVAIVDVRMPVLDGIACTEAIVAEGLPTRVLAVTSFESDEHVYRMLRAGAAGFVLKDIEPMELVQAIRVIADGQALLVPSALRRLVDRFARPSSALPTGPDALSVRELEILRFVAAGLSNEEITRRAHVSVSTVKTHISALLGKLGCRDRAQLVVEAYERGVVDVGRRGNG